jgi:hypothetical protein
MKALQPRLAEITGRPAPRGGKPVQHEKWSEVNFSH